MLTKTIDYLRVQVRHVMEAVARLLDRATGGRLHPDTVTIVGAVLHLPIAYFIATGSLVMAAVLLVVFGLFDTLDGSLARLQKRTSATGMLLDATTDRMKEVALYGGIVYLFATTGQPAYFLLAAVVACGASLSVSYVKAKGEAAYSASGAKLPPDQLNRIFGDGLLTFDVRMFLLVVGLAVGQLPIIISCIAVLASWTALQRLLMITKALA